MQVGVGRIGRPHGVRGDVNVEPRTDEPDRRFAPGSTLTTDHAGHPNLTVEGHRWHSSRLLVSFADVGDRTAAEGLRGVLLSTVVDPVEVPEDPDEFYDHQLVGLAVVDRTGSNLGTVAEVVHGAQDLLVVTRDSGGRVLVPFVAAMVPEVDLRRGYVVVDLPDGLLDLVVE
ncbi:MAG: ribosome maturation factor RimM [Actinomycetia bacterium]|nr:ribosome maturation factor RimM [Actinomycetes bacterium]